MIVPGSLNEIDSLGINFEDPNLPYFFFLLTAVTHLLDRNRLNTKLVSSPILLLK